MSPRVPLAGFFSVGACAFGALAACAGADLLAIGPDERVLFLVQEVPAEAVPQALFQGRVVLDGAGCLRLEGSETHTVIWPHGSVLLQDGVSLIVDSTEGGRLRIGELTALGGGELTDPPAPPTLSEPFRAAALERCPGRYWLVGSILPHPGR